LVVPLFLAAFSSSDNSGSSSPTSSTARLVRRPILVPIRLSPPPIPLAVSVGLVTALAAPFPTLIND